MVTIRFSRLARLFSFFLALILVQLPTTGHAAPRKSRVVKARIIGGHDSLANAYPWATYIQVDTKDPVTGVLGRSACGASLVAPRWLITAAHCLKNATSLIAAVGVIDRTPANVPASKLFAADQVITHPSYNPANQQNDIALVRLSAASLSAPIYLATAGDAGAAVTGTPLTVIGWGTTTPTGTVTSTTLKEALVDVVAPADCTAKYAAGTPPLAITSNMLCAAAAGRDTCKGDSGGPSMFHNGTRFTLLGVTSLGRGCADPNFPGVYTRAANYRDWIALMIQYSDPTTPGDTFFPVIDSIAPAAGATLSGSGQFTAKVADNLRVNKVTFAIDGVPVQEFFTAPYTANYNISSLSEGTHKFKVTVTDSKISEIEGALYYVDGNAKSQEISFLVQNLPKVTVGPVSRVVAVGATAAFSVTAIGSPTLTYQWKKRGVAIAGATGSSYTTPATVAADDQATYSVTVTNARGSATSASALLTVVTKPVITTQPAATAKVVGTAASFSVSASGRNLTYQWFENGVKLTGATSSVFTVPAVTAAHNGRRYTCTVTNIAGSVTSNQAILTVNVPAAIGTQPFSRTVAAGLNTTFTVVATGDAPFTYQWFRNGVAIANAIGASYTVNATWALNASKFKVVVKNKFNTVGATSSEAILTVNAPVTITTQPVNKTILAGQAVTFSVGTAGSTPITYQWYKNNVAIAGATAASLTLTNVPKTSTNTKYKVSVKNAFTPLAIYSVIVNLTVN